MTRPATVKPDNFFLLIYRALRQRRVPVALRIVSHSLLLVAAALVIYAGIMSMQFRHAMQQQADALGQSLVTQTANSAAELLVANDNLSLNVLLGNLARNPLVAHAAVYSPDNRVLAESGTRPSQGLLTATDGIYSTPIRFQDVTAGQVRLALDMDQFQQPMMISLQNMGLLGLILLALTLILSLRLGRQLSTPLLELRVWLRDPDDPAPGAGRLDELGDLARQLQSRLVPPKPPKAEAATEDDPFADEAGGLSVKPPATRKAPAAKPAARKPAKPAQPESDELDADAFSDLVPESFTEPPATPAPALPTEPDIVTSAVLAIQLGAQDQLSRLPRSRLEELLGRYRDCLQQATALYDGELHTLKDGGSLILFHERSDDDDYLTRALCCGEIMRALGHALQVEVIGSGATLQLQLGLTQGERLAGLELAQLLDNTTVRNAQALSRHSRNLLLVEQSIAEDELLRKRARIRTIASPAGASCVERLLEPYSATLERHLVRLEAR